MFCQVAAGLFDGTVKAEFHAIGLPGVGGSGLLGDLGLRPAERRERPTRVEASARKPFARMFVLCVAAAAWLFSFHRPADIIQGQIGTCFFLGAAVSAYPGLPSQWPLDRFVPGPFSCRCHTRRSHVGNRSPPYFPILSVVRIVQSWHWLTLNFGH